MGFEGKVAIVTGAGSGIGRATAIKLAEKGVKVVVAELNVAGGEETEAIIRRNNGEAVFVPTDVTKPEDAERVVRVALERFDSPGGKRVDILVNCAGVLRYGLVEDLSVDDWDLTIAVNLKGTFLCCKAVVPVMKRQKDGVIINVSSSGARSYPVHYPAYVAGERCRCFELQDESREL